MHTCDNNFLDALRNVPTRAVRELYLRVLQTESQGHFRSAIELIRTRYCAFVEMMSIRLSFDDNTGAIFELLQNTLTLRRVEIDVTYLGVIKPQNGHSHHLDHIVYFAVRARQVQLDFKTRFFTSWIFHNLLHLRLDSIIITSHVIDFLLIHGSRLQCLELCTVHSSFQLVLDNCPNLISSTLR